MPSWLDGRLAFMIWINFAARAVSASPGDLARIEVGEAAWPHAFLAAVAGLPPPAGCRELLPRGFPLTKDWRLTVATYLRRNSPQP